MSSQRTSTCIFLEDNTSKGTRCRTADLLNQNVILLLRTNNLDPDSDKTGGRGLHQRADLEYKLMRERRVAFAAHERRLPRHLLARRTLRETHEEVGMCLSAQSHEHCLPLLCPLIDEMESVRIQSQLGSAQATAGPQTLCFGPETANPPFGRSGHSQLFPHQV